MFIGGRDFDLKNNVYIMGILNVTPDSFSDGGKWNDIDGALRRCSLMISEGASIIDVGGESTRPGYAKVDDDEEISRVVPVICAIRERFDIPLSIDTYKAKVAREAIAAGADMINDIWGLKYDKEMACLAAKSKVPVCIMHNRNIDEEPYEDFITDVVSDLKKSVKIGMEAGIADDRIIIDPGIGFAKDVGQNLLLMNRLDILSELGFPMLMGASGKSVIGHTLNLPVNERLEGTLATTVMAVERGCSIIRVHHVKENFRAAAMAKAILQAK